MVDCVKTFRSVSRPIQFVCGAFGITMLGTFKTNVARGLNSAYAFVVSLILLAAIVVRIQYVSPKYGCLSVIIHSVICIQQALIALSIVAIYYQTIRYPNAINSVLEMLAAIDRDFARFNVKFDYRFFQWKILLEIIGLSAAIHITFVALCVHDRTEPLVAIIYELLARFYPIFVINSALLMFINLCCLIKCKFTALKKLLRSFQAPGALQRVDRDDVWKIKMSQSPPRTFCGEIRQIVDMYESLCATVNRLNSIFGLMNLATLALLAISLTCHLFLLVKILMESPASFDGTTCELFGVCSRE